MRELPVVAIGGPTGAGKSDLGLFLASRLDGEIVNYDSVQVYRGFNIGAAKTPESQREGIAHHLLDIRDGWELYTAGDFARDAAAAVQSIAARGRLPILVGGTGFYLRALLEGISDAPSRDEALRQDLLRRERRRPGSVRRLLERLDPQSAARIHANDLNKTVRALELRVRSRKPGNAYFASAPLRPLPGCRSLVLVLEPPRDVLRERLDERCELMWQAGLVEEVRGLLAAGVPPGAKPLSSLGYKQALAFLRGEATRSEALAEMKLRTHQYAKRQLTWFRNQHDGVALPGFGSDAGVKRSALDIVNAWVRPA